MNISRTVWKDNNGKDHPLLVVQEGKQSFQFGYGKARLILGLLEHPLGAQALRDFLGTTPATTDTPKEKKIKVKKIKVTESMIKQMLSEMLAANGASK